MDVFAHNELYVLYISILTDMCVCVSERERCSEKKLRQKRLYSGLDSIERKRCRKEQQRGQKYENKIQEINEQKVHNNFLMAQGHKSGGEVEAQCLTDIQVILKRITQPS